MFNAQTQRSNWWGFIGKRVVFAVIAFFVMSFAILFTISYPYHSLKYAPEFTPFDFPPFIEINEQLGYDDPYSSQYFRWLGNFVTGNWGGSFINHIPIRDLIF